MASSELLAAQEKLAQLQAEAKARKSKDVPWETVEEGQPFADYLSLPHHLGWGSGRLASALRDAVVRQAKQLEQQTAVSQVQQILNDIQPQNYPPATIQNNRPDWINHYPSLGMAALQQGEASTYRVWLMCRHLDDAGTGCLAVADLKALLTATNAQYRLFSWKRLKQVLYAGNGRLWHWNQTEEKIWLVGVTKLAQVLGVQKLVGMRVRVPIKVLVDGIGSFRAHLYAAWHSGRRSEKPISREVQRQLTHVPERTQRHYGRIAKIKTEKNVAIGNKVSPLALEQEAWQRGQAVFVYTDRAGKFGTVDGRFLAWQLPNSYNGPHQQAPFGRQQKINQRLKQSQLKDLVEIGAQGNRELKDDQLYYANGSEAVKALKQASETYWPTNHNQQTQFWAVLQAS